VQQLLTAGDEVVADVWQAVCLRQEVPRRMFKSW
jgi:hypothetical protein